MNYFSTLKSAVLFKVMSSLVSTFHDHTLGCEFTAFLQLFIPPSELLQSQRRCLRLFKSHSNTVIVSKGLAADV